MILVKQIFKDCIVNKNYSKYLFRLGIFLLPSAMMISFLLILLSLVEVFRKNFDKFLKDKWTKGFIVSIPFLLISCFSHKIDNDLQSNISLSLIGLFNWIPYFFCFFGFQYYLSSEKDRNLISKLLIAGTVPVIFSAIMQYF